VHGVIFIALTFTPGVLAVVLIAVLKSRGRVSQAERPEKMVRTASLTASDVSGGGGWLLGMLSTLLLPAGTAALLALRWQTIPARFPIHWGISGQPNGWAERSFGSVFGLLLLTVALMAGLSLLGELIARSSPGYEGRSAMIKTARTILVACSWFLTFLLCAISLLPLSHNPTNLVPLVLAGAVVFSLGVVVYVAFHASRMQDVLVASQNSTDARFWKAGLFYFNPGDSALMVPKRDGFGYTVNFGRPVSWLIFVAIILLGLVMPLLMHVSKHR